MAVQPSLPVPGVDVILGNGLDKDRVWPSGPLPPVVITELVGSAYQDECATEFPAVFSW